MTANLCIKKLDKTRLIELKHITKNDYCLILRYSMKISFKLKSAQAITHLSIQELISKDKLKQHLLSINPRQLSLDLAQQTLLHLQQDKLLGNLRNPNFEVPKSIRLIYRYLESSCVICVGLKRYGFLEDVVMDKYSHELNTQSIDQSIVAGNRSIGEMKIDECEQKQ